jgi:hypothetical protein
VLDEAARQAQEVRDLLRSAANTPRERRGGIAISAQLKVKGALENLRSSLDYLAHELGDAYGKPGARTYYPLCKSDSEFPGCLKKKLPGVQEGAPDGVVALLRSHQSFQAEHDWMTWLADQVNPLKHKKLTQHNVHSIDFIDIAVPGGGFSIRVPRQFAGEGQSQYLAPGWKETSMVAVRWIFEGTNLGVNQTLFKIEKGARQVVEDFGALLEW